MVAGVFVAPFAWRWEPSLVDWNLASLGKQLMLFRLPSRRRFQQGKDYTLLDPDRMVNIINVESFDAEVRGYSHWFHETLDRQRWGIER